MPRNASAAISGKLSNFEELAAALESMDTSISNLVDINMSFAEISNTWAQQEINQMRLELILAALIASLFGVGFAILLTRSVTRPLSILEVAAANMAKGDLNRNMSEATKEAVRGLKDEVGAVARSLTATRLYMTEMADTATRIAAGDLTMQVTPKSEQDELGIAFKAMVNHLHAIMEGIAENAIPSFPCIRTTGKCGKPIWSGFQPGCRHHSGSRERHESANTIDHRHRRIR